MGCVLCGFIVIIVNFLNGIDRFGEGKRILFENSIDITFDWDTTNALIGKHTLKMEIPPVPGEENNEDNVKTITIEVTEPTQ